MREQDSDCRQMKGKNSLRNCTRKERGNSLGKNKGERNLELYLLVFSPTHQVVFPALSDLLPRGPDQGDLP